MLRPRYGRDAFRMSCSALNERALHSFPGQVVSVSRLAPRRSASWLANLGGMARAAGSARPGGSAAPSSSDPNIPSNLPPGTRVYTQTKTLPFSQSQLFTLVADVNRYHEFLPFCTMSRVVGPADGESTPLPREDLTSQTLTSASSIEESSFSPPASPPPASMSTMRGPAARSSTKTQSLDPISTLISFFQPRIAPALDTSTSDTSSLSSLPPSTLPESPRPPATPAVQGKESQATYRAVLADLGIGYGAFQEEYRSKVELTGQEIVRATALPGSNPLFTHLSTTWRLTPVPSSQLEATRIDYALAYGFARTAHAWAASAVFSRTASMIMNAFERRAQELYPKH